MMLWIICLLPLLTVALPPAIPLAVRSPYLSAWSVASIPLNEQDPTFWNGASLGWDGLIRIDGSTYRWMGKGHHHELKAKQRNVEVTATKSIFTFQAGSVVFNVTFFTPIEPKDLVRLSLPFSYLSMDFESSEAHSVQVYSAVNGYWLSGDRQQRVMSSRCETGNAVVGLCSHLGREWAFAEIEEQAEYGTLMWATRAASKVSSSVGSDNSLLQSSFDRTGTLPESEPSHHSETVNALSRDFGSVSFGSIIFAIGHVRDPVVQYRTETGKVEHRSLLSFKRFGSFERALELFLDDFERASKDADALDQRIWHDSMVFGSEQALLSAYTVRQVYAATEITVGTKDTDVMIFMKEISSNGNMNTIDVVFPALPLFYYLTPEFIPLLLEPLMRFQQSGQWHERYTIHDIGRHYPNATGHPDGDHSEAMPLEETGNIMLMALAYAQATGRPDLVTRYPKLFRQWAQELEETALWPSNQLSTDDFMGFLPNQTSLALKGVLGLGAYAKLRALTGDLKLAAHYRRMAVQYAARWEMLALSRSGSHTKLAFHLDDSWSLLYNLYMDKLLGLELISENVYKLQLELVEGKRSIEACSGKEPLAIALDTRKPWNLTPWLAFQAGALHHLSPKTSRSLISSIIAYAHNPKNSAPLGDWFNVCTGRTKDFRARPVIGGHFALLALEKARRSSVKPDYTETSQLVLAG